MNLISVRSVSITGCWGMVVVAVVTTTAAAAAAATAAAATTAAAVAAARSFASCDGNLGLDINCTKWITIGRGSDLIRATRPLKEGYSDEIHGKNRVWKNTSLEHYSDVV